MKKTLEQRIDALEEKVEKRIKTKDGTSKWNKKLRSHGPAFRIVTEMLAGILFGLILGWALTEHFGLPSYVYVFTLITGLVGGMYGVVKIAMKPTQTPSKQPKTQKTEPNTL